MVENIEAGYKVEEDENNLLMAFLNIEQFLAFYDNFVLKRKLYKEGFGVIFNKEVDNGQNTNGVSEQGIKQAIGKSNSGPQVQNQAA